MSDLQIIMSDSKLLEENQSVCALAIIDEDNYSRHPTFSITAVELLSIIHDCYPYSIPSQYYPMQDFEERLHEWSIGNIGR